MAKTGQSVILLLAGLVGFHDYKEKGVKGYKLNVNNSNHICLINQGIRVIK